MTRFALLLLMLVAGSATAQLSIPSNGGALLTNAVINGEGDGNESRFSSLDGLSVQQSQMGGVSVGMTPSNIEESANVLAFDISAMGRATVTGTDVGQYGSEFALTFEISSTPAQLRLQGSMNATSDTLKSGSGTIRLDDGTGDVLNLRVVAPPSGDLSDELDINRTLTLDPGRYTFVAQLGGTVTSAVPNSDSSLDLAFRLTQEAVVTEVFWSANNGAYDEESNWEPSQVPDEGQTAIFDRNATYRVTLSNPETGRAVVERGIVTLDGSTYMLSGGSANEPALIVGRNSSDPATLSMDVGNVSSEYTTIGQGANSSGFLSLFNGADWADGGRVVVGDAGQGELRLTDGAKLTSRVLSLGEAAGSTGYAEVTGSAGSSKQDDSFGLETQEGFVVGNAGSGEFQLTNARIRTGLTILGGGSSGTGIATISESPQFAFWEFGESFIVGDAGMGTLDIQEGGVVRAAEGGDGAIVVADEPGAVGTVTVGGTFATIATTGAISVGPRGDGSLVLTNGGVLGAGSLNIGPAASPKGMAARGDVLVEGTGEIPDEAHVKVSGDLNVGNYGDGALVANGEAYLESVRGLIGAEDGGNGAVTLETATWELSDRLLIGLAERDAQDEIVGVLGRGTLTLMEGTVNTPLFFGDRGAMITGSGQIVAEAGLCECDIAPGVETEEPGNAKQAPDSIGTLTFDGSIDFANATIEIDVLSPTMTDTIAVTGDATVMNSTIAFNFVDGYLPQTGDEIPFIVAGGALTFGGDTTLQYTGAAEGFEFDVVSENGMLMFEALNDAQPAESTGSGCAAGPGQALAFPPAYVVTVLAGLLVLGRRRATP